MGQIKARNKSKVFLLKKQFKARIKVRLTMGQIKAAFRVNHHKDFSDRLKISPLIGPHR